MRTHHTPVSLLSAFAILLGAAACGGSDAADQADAPAAADAAPVENPATITGSVAFTGDVPPVQPIDMSEEPTCADKHETGADSEEVAVRDGMLSNVFIYVKEGLSGTHAASTDNVVIDQDGCIYHPRVAGVQTGQTIVFRNSDGLLHNIKAVPTANRGFNISQPNNMDTPRTFSTREVMVPIECNVHGWMKAYVGVLDHPYFAVSGADGAFSIGNLPPGTYTIEAWHERYGTQTQQVTVGPNESTSVAFTFDAGMAGAHVPLGAPLDPHSHAVAMVHDHGTGTRR